MLHGGLCKADVRLDALELHRTCSYNFASLRAYAQKQLSIRRVRCASSSATFCRPSKWKAFLFLRRHDDSPRRTRLAKARRVFSFLRPNEGRSNQSPHGSPCGLFYWQFNMAILKISTVCMETGISRSQFYAHVKDGLMVRPAHIGPRAVGVPDYEVHAINRARIAGKSESEIRSLVDQLHTARRDIMAVQP